MRRVKVDGDEEVRAGRGGVQPETLASSIMQVACAEGSVHAAQRADEVTRFTHLPHEQVDTRGGGAAFQGYHIQTSVCRLSSG